MIRLQLAVAGVAIASLAGCQPADNSELLGTATGAAIGAGLGMAVSGEGDKTEGALVGGGAGALMAALLQADARKRAVQGSAAPAPQSSVSARQQPIDPYLREVYNVYDDALQLALTTGESRSWQMQDFSGTIYPSGMRSDRGRTCRSYRSFWRSSTTSEIDDGVACLEPGGVWRDQITG